MARYSLLINRSAAKELEDLAPQVRRRGAMRLEGLATEPRPEGAEQVAGQETYRLRQGDSGVLYLIDDGAQTVTIVRSGHRRHVR